MEELVFLLRDHAARYPLMEPTDAVKLLYQNEFGGGHLIRDEGACLQYLQREYSMIHKHSDAPAWEPIGNGMIRVNLACLEPDRIPQLAAAFIRSASAHTGSKERFRQKLELLRGVCREGIFSFSPEALEAYLRPYEQADFPMVSHSAAYRAAYQPAYRVVCLEHWPIT